MIVNGHDAAWAVGTLLQLSSDSSTKPALYPWIQANRAPGQFNVAVTGQDAHTMLARWRVAVSVPWPDAPATKKRRRWMRRLCVETIRLAYRQVTYGQGCRWPS